MPYIPLEVAQTEQSQKITSCLGPANQGKVRDVYDLGEHLLIVTTDRVSSDDHVLSQGIDEKGKVLNSVAVFWFGENLDRNHLVAAGSAIDPHLPKQLRGDADLQARAMIAKKCRPALIECVARGYLAGSGWKDYRLQNGMVCGVQLPEGLREGDKLPEPIFTPATKAASGHDFNITEEDAAELVPGGMTTVQELKRRTIDTYRRGAQKAEAGGIIIADTKFEYGLYEQRWLLIDEVLTPDSSRFWPRSLWEELQAKGGGTPASFDKQYLRDYLKPFNFSAMTDEEAAKVVLPEAVRAHLSSIYIELLRRITGMTLPEFLHRRLGIA